MTLHISEIAVQLAVGDTSRPPPDDDGGTVPGGPALTGKQMDAMVQECTYRVLAALRLEQGR